MLRCPNCGLDALLINDAAAECHECRHQVDPTTARFMQAGIMLTALGAVTGTSGNLSTWDGRAFFITTRGSTLANLTHRDIIGQKKLSPALKVAWNVTMHGSSDLQKHLVIYRDRGPGAVAHGHPPGSVPEGWSEGDPHGTYAHAETLTDAVLDASRWPAAVGA